MSRNTWAARNWEDRDRIRRWRKRIYRRLFVAVGWLLLAYVWLTLLPAVWWSDLARNDVLLVAAWIAMGQIGPALWLRRLWREGDDREKE